MKTLICKTQIKSMQNFLTKKPTDTILGCVMTAETWRFLCLQNSELTFDSKSYGTNDLEKVLGIFQQITDFYKK